MMGFLAEDVTIITLLALTGIVLLVLGAIVWAAAQGADKEERNKSAERQAARRANTDSLKQSFRRAVELIEANLATRAERYKLAWTLVLNESEAGRELPLVASGIPSALSTDSAMGATGHGIAWNFFDQGVAIQLQSSYLGDPDDATSVGNKVWDEFLGLARGYRADRPFDAVVLALPASMLLTADPQAEMDLVARAKVFHRRLWLAQNRFALQFPISLVVTGCEVLPGFTAFAAALPEALRRSMLGWSSPYELSAPFQSQWIDSGVDDVTRDVQDACAELCALEPAGQDSSAYFRLPAEIERLRRGLKLFTEELMRPSAYHEPFVLRGFYLSGDCSPASELVAAFSRRDLTEEQPAPRGEDDLASTAVASGVHGGLAIQQSETTVPGGLEQAPAFLRDIFEKKIFAESGLVRASRTQRLSRPAVGRAVAWSLSAVSFIWAIGLVLSGLRLHTAATDIESALKLLDRDSRSSLAGSTSDPAQLRNRAVSTLALINQADAGLFNSIFMPGSWSVFDDLHRRLAVRLERGFTASTVEPLRMSAYASVSELTGVPTDPSTGLLIAGAACSPPANTAGSTQSGLNPEDLPEFTNLLRFADRLDEIDLAIRAMQRLAEGPRPPQGEDLKLVVRVFLGVEMSGDFQRAAELFRQQASHATPMSTAVIHQASVCAFAAESKALREHLFDNNDLLEIEQNLVAQIQVQETTTDDWEAARQGWSDVLEEIRQESALTLPGKGAWMRRKTLVLGPAWDTLIHRLQANRLIGQEAVGAEQKRVEDSFSQFLGQWDALADGGAGLVWSDKEDRWSASQDRADLRDGLATVFALPAMKPGRRKLPAVPEGATVGWDRFKLDQAIAFGEARKKFESDVISKLPAPSRDSIDAMFRGALSDGLVDTVAQAIVISSHGGQVPVVAEADRTRVLKVQMTLDELGDEASADSLGQLLARDALTRLKMLDDTLLQSDVYLPRDPDFRSWNGGKSPVLSAFGVSDAAGLASYAAQQQAFVEGLAKEADILLKSFGDIPLDPVAQRWRAIVLDLGRYRLKSPASSLANLEQFLLNGASGLDLQNCSERLRPATRRAGDFFAERLFALQTGLANRCHELRTSESQEGWNRMAAAFNRDLSGRAPFRAMGTPDRPPAAVEELVSVLHTYDRVRRLTEDRSTMPANLKRFAEQMDRVSAFLTPLVPTDEGSASGYDVSVKFRANASSEVEGNKVIDWAISIGSQTLHWRDPARALRWEPGQPVTVSLRVARNSPVSPGPDPTQPTMSVEDRTVSFRFGDPWSLFSMIAGQREPDVAGRTDARSELLRFEFPLLATASGESKALAQKTHARVFLRLTLTPAGKRTPLAWPPSFPTTAPKWVAP